MSLPLLNLELRLELDIVLCRQRARQIAALLGFDQLDQTRIATATSEIARNAVQYAGGGRAEFLVESAPQPAFLIRIRERGPGIRDLQTILDGTYVSQTGLGIGIVGAKRLMDRFTIESAPNAGALVSMSKTLPNRTVALTPQELARISNDLARNAPRTLLEELQQQNQELLETLQELRESQAEISQLHSRELDETNRGVVALYAELDEGTKALQRLSDLKSRFLSEMSHELRSPLNSIRSLTGFLLARSDGELTGEQEKQVQFIRQAAEGLSVLVDDLLDLAKVAAGKAVIRAGWFNVGNLLENLLGTIRPMVVREQVSLVFETPTDMPALHTDAGKVEQILRNFLTNALKFTERGRIRLRSQRAPGDRVLFSVSDTGIGIAAEDLDRIFEEFGQLENPLQRRVKGTGLGLPLARKLAQLLGGDVYVQSEPGVGSTFFASIPRFYQAESENGSGADSRWQRDPARLSVLLISSNSEELGINEQEFDGSGFQLFLLRSFADAREAIQELRPIAIVVDLSDDPKSAAALLSELESDDRTRDLAALVIGHEDQRTLVMTLNADDFCVKPLVSTWLLERLVAIEARRSPEKALIVDDRERDRYLIKEALTALGRFVVIEADRGDTAIRLASARKPDVIFLDLGLPDLNGLEILNRLKADPETQNIPVVINTSEILNDEKRRQLAENAVAVLSKGNESRNEMIAQVRGSLIKAGLYPSGQERAD
jgi:signal transduction histidine kinase/CheY-like chemotaxis protein